VAQRVPARHLFSLGLNMHDLARRPRTLVPPPLVYAVALGAAWWLEPRWSLAFDLGFPGRLVAWGLIGVGLAVFAWALMAIWKQRTTVNPYKAASNLVTHGPFAWSRNPIYVSDWFVYLGVTLLLGTAWPFLFAPLVWVVMRFAVIAHEEAHLVAKFGDEYLEYRTRVRRWI
jgi:protein-S-isoprenylcysteine O-methyltransferase Ste14